MEGEHEALLQQVFEQAAVGVCIFDLAGRVVQANPACCRLSDMSEGELKGRHWAALTHRDDVEHQLTCLKSLRSGQIDTYTMVGRIGRKSLWTEVTVSALRDPQGKPVRFLAIILDRTQQHQAESLLRRSQEKYRDLVELTPDGIARFGADHRIRFANSSMAKILRRQPEECQGRTLAELSQPESLTTLWDEALEAVLQTACARTLECQWEDRYYYCRLIPESHAEGEPAVVLALLQDFTGQRQAREERKQRLLRAERLDEVGRHLAQAGLDGQAALDGIAEFAARFIGETCFITLLSADGQHLEAASIYDQNPERCALARRLLALAPFRAQGPIYSRVIPTAQALRIPHVPEGLLETVLRPEHRVMAQQHPVFSLLAVPMRANGRVAGAVTLASFTAERSYTEEDQALLQELADRAALTLAHARLYEELEMRVAARTQELAEANARLQQLAARDGLTGLANRRAFDQALEAELRRARREDRWVSLIMLDIDYFKRYNDSLGHQAGDACLQQVAAVLEASFRRGADLVARYGGEEFAVILPDLTPERALQKAEELRQAVEDRQLPHPDSPVSAVVTVSLGIYSERARAASTPADFIARADEALYASKSGGRNRVTGSSGATQAQIA